MPGTSAHSNCPAPENSARRNRCLCTCGSWQLVHSILPLISFTAPIGSAVLPCATSDDDQIRRILHRQHQTERMRAAEIRSERIHVVHVPTHGQLCRRPGLSDGHRAVMTTQTQAAGDAEGRLRIARLVIGGAGVGL